MAGEQAFASSMEPSTPATPPECCHAHPVYCTGQSELKGEDKMFVQHRRPWPGTDLTGSSLHSVRSDSSTGSGDLDPRWLPVDFSPACPDCGTLTAHYSLFCIFDGHNGVHAAKMCEEAVLPILEARLPLGCPPPPTHGLYTRWREMVQRGLVETMVELNSLFSKRGIHAGATATIVLQHDWLVTTVNLGDSRAVLDTGADTVALTEDHRVATHKGERKRVKEMGGIVAPVSMSGSGPADDYNSGVGPLRIWPGGLCLSRAIGDFDVGEAVLPFPHVTQVMLPPSGGRLLVASDGVWDAFDKMSRVGSMMRSWPLESAPSRLIQTIVRAFGGLKDDTTMVVADILPQGVTFQQVVAAAKKGGSGGGASNGIPIPARADGGRAGGGSAASSAPGGCCGFGGPSPTMEDTPLSSSLDASVASSSSVSVRAAGAVGSSIRGGRPKATVLADLDVAALMQLMPETTLEVPGWYTPEVGDVLFESATKASDDWQMKHNSRYARAPTTPVIPEVGRQRRGRKSVAFSEDVEVQHLPPMFPARSASADFAYAVAENGQEFARKFGHYEQGPGHLSREQSVRAGRVYNSEGSMRAGTAHLQPSTDPDVRVTGSGIDKSVHLRSSAAGDDDLTGLAPVRVAKRGGTDVPSRPIDMPVGGQKEKLETFDSAADVQHRLSSIGE